MKLHLRVTALIFVLCIPTNQSCRIDDVTWTATLAEQDQGSNSNGHDENNTSSLGHNDYDHANHNDTTADARREIALEKENDKSQSTDSHNDSSVGDNNNENTISVETFLIPEIEQQPFITDIIKQLEKLCADPEKRTELEKEMALCIKESNTTWHFNKEEARKKANFIGEILSGALIEKLRNIANGQRVESLLNGQRAIHQIWPWQHKTYQIPPDRRSPEQVFNELLGINIMERVELAVHCNPKYLKLLHKESQLEIKKIIEEYRNYMAMGDSAKFESAYTELRWSIYKSRTIFPSTVSAIAVATAVARHHIHDMQKNHERTTALIEQLTIEKESLAPVLAEYKALTPDNTSLLAAKQLARIQPLERFLQDPNSWCTLALKNHSLTDQGKDVLTLYGMDATAQNKLCTLFGNDLQHAAYDECITAINDVAAQHATSTPLTELETLIIDQALIGCEAVAAGHIKQAYSFTDICWTALECIKGTNENVINSDQQPTSTQPVVPNLFEQHTDMLSSVAQEFVKSCGLTPLNAHEFSAEHQQFFQRSDALLNAVAQAYQDKEISDIAATGTAVLTRTAQELQITGNSDKAQKLLTVAEKKLFNDGYDHTHPIDGYDVIEDLEAELKALQFYYNVGKHAAQQILHNIKNPREFFHRQVDGVKGCAMISTEILNTLALLSCGDPDMNAPIRDHDIVLHAAEQKFDSAAAGIKAVVDHISKMSQPEFERFIGHILGDAIVDTIGMKGLGKLKGIVKDAAMRKLSEIKGATQEMGTAASELSAAEATAATSSAGTGQAAGGKTGRGLIEQVGEGAELAEQNAVKNISRSHHAFNLSEFDSSVGNIEKINEHFESLKKINGALDKDGPLTRFLEYGKKCQSSGSIAAAKGAAYELETALELLHELETLEFAKKVSLVDEATQRIIRTFDIAIATATKYIECKNWYWDKVSPKKINDLQSYIAELDKLAKQNSKLFQFYSKQPIPDFLKNWLLKKNISFIEGL